MSRHTASKAVTEHCPSPKQSDSSKLGCPASQPQTPTPRKPGTSSEKSPAQDLTLRSASNPQPIKTNHPVMVVKIRLARFGETAQALLQHRRCASPVLHPSLPSSALPLTNPPTLNPSPHENPPLTPSQKHSPQLQTLEVLGTYDPIPKPPSPGEEGTKPFKDIRLDTARAKYWLGVGAQPSEPAWRLLSMVRFAFFGEEGGGGGGQGLGKWNDER